MTLWTPANAASPYAWYKAKSSADYTLSGGTITAIADKLGLGHGASGRNGCGFSATGLDGALPAFTFNGSSQSLDMAVPANLTKVAYVFWANLANQYQSVFGASQTGSYSCGYDGSAVFLDSFQNAGIVHSGSMPTGTPSLVVVTRNSTTGDYEVRVNGTSVASGNFSYAAGSITDTHILGGVFNRDYANGAIAEAMVFSDYDNATLEQIEGYVLWDWGYQSLLPAGHTYKAAAPTTGASGVTGTLAATEAADAFAATGGVGVSGSWASTEAKDAFAGAGLTAAFGTLAATDAPDAAAVTGTIGAAGAVTGSLAASDTPDSLAAVGSVAIAGALAVAEARDTFAAAGAVLFPVAGSWVSAELADAFFAAGLSTVAADTENRLTIPAELQHALAPAFPAIVAQAEPHVLICSEPRQRVLP